jgi:phosphoesterase RecJ-like protein
MNEWEQISEYISKSKNILLSTHRDPDGDGLGSEIGFYYYLKSIHKNVNIVNISPTPDRYKFLDEENIIKSYDNGNSHLVSNSDLVIVFDLGDFNRLGEISEIIKENNINIINVDHHIPENDSMYTLSVVHDKSPSTTYMIWKYFEYLNINDSPLSDNIAIALYAGLVNDTGSFRYSLVTSDSHNMASHLLESNVKPNDIYREIYENKSIIKLNLEAAMIKNLQFAENNKVAYSIVSKDTFNNLGATAEDAGGFAELIRQIEGVEISFSIIQKNDIYRISFRSDGIYTVKDIASLFGGGGHLLAAGCAIKESDLDETIETILAECKRKINNGN